MSGFIKKHPALSLFLLAVLLGQALVAPVLLGWAPRGFVQLGALPGSARPVLAPWYQLMPTMLFQMVGDGMAAPAH